MHLHLFYHLLQIINENRTKFKLEFSTAFCYSLAAV